MPNSHVMCYYIFNVAVDTYVVKVLASSSYDDTIKLYSADGDDWSCFDTLGNSVVLFSSH